MHLLIPFAAPSSQAGQQALDALKLPHLETLLARWAAGARDEGDETSFSPPHERARARALGLPGDDGQQPWAAWAARQAGLDADAAWALLTPAHWSAGSDQFTMLDPALLALDDASSRALLDALRPLFEAEGFALHWQAPLAWLAAHPALDGLRTAALDRVIGRGVERWLPPLTRREGGPSPARLLRRLQNEAQMLLHDHPINQDREARGELPVNSLWVSGCGRLPPGTQGAEAAALTVDDRLRRPALADDWAAWVDAWHALDAGPIAQLLQSAAPASDGRLTLCGERACLEFTAQPRPLLQRLHLAAQRRPAAPLLQSI